MYGFSQDVLQTTNVNHCYAAPPPAVPCGATASCTYASAMQSQCRPTVFPTPNYDPTGDAQKLRKAMKGLGTDEETLIAILGSKTTTERQMLKSAFKSNFGRDLDQDLDSELSGNFRDLVRMIMFPTPMHLASQLFKAMDGAGTRENIVIEILCTATNGELKEIKDAYKEYLAIRGKRDPKRSLESDVMGDFSGDLKHLLVALLQGKREEPDPEAVKLIPQFGINSVVNMRQVQDDCEKLYNAGEKKLGTDEETFVQILATRSFYHIQALDEAYKVKTGHDLRKAIRKEFSGDMENALCTLVEAIVNKSLYFAKVLHDAMAGAGTRDRVLMTTVAWRSEIDMLDIKDAFMGLYHKSLESWIKDDTSGDYKKLLLQLVGGQWRK